MMLKRPDDKTLHWCILAGEDIAEWHETEAKAKAGATEILREYRDVLEEPHPAILVMHVRWQA